MTAPASSRVVSTMQDAQLTITSLLRHGQTVYADSRVRTFEGDSVREATYAEVGERAARLAGALAPDEVAGLGEVLVVDALDQHGVLLRSMAGDACPEGVPASS